MSKTPASINKRILISAQRADRLKRLAKAHSLSENQIIEKALDILFDLTELLDAQAERRGWSFLSEDSLSRVWNNEEDAIYDDWEKLYGISAR